MTSIFELFKYRPTVSTTRPSRSTAIQISDDAPLEIETGIGRVSLSETHSGSDLDSTSVSNDVRKLSTNATLAILDQGVVSATSFFTMLTVSRACGAESLAYFSLGMTFFLVSTSLQLAFVAPYTLLIRSSSITDKKAFAGSAFLGSIFSALSAMIITALLYPAFLFSGVVPGFEKLIVVVLLFSPFSILRDFARKVSFANMMMSTALRLDIAVAILQVAALSILSQQGLLTPANGLVVVGCACALPACYWIASNRTQFRLHFESVTGHLKTMWRLGKWILLENFLAIAGAYAVHWMLILMLDPESTGLFAACFLIVNLSSPFLQGMGNIIAPSFAAVSESPKLLHRRYSQTTLLILLPMILFVVSCYLFGEFGISLVIKETSNLGLGMIVALLAFRAMIGVISITTHHALIALQAPEGSFWCTLCGLGTVIGVGIFLIPKHGIYGGVLAMIAGTTVEASAIFIWYLIVQNERSRESRETKTNPPNRF